MRFFQLLAVTNRWPFAKDGMDKSGLKVDLPKQIAFDSCPFVSLPFYCYYSLEAFSCFCSPCWMTSKCFMQMDRAESFWRLSIVAAYCFSPLSCLFRVHFSVEAPKCPDFGTQLDCDKAALPQITPRDQHRKRFCRIISPPHPLFSLSTVTHTLLFVFLVYFIAQWARWEPE